VSDAHKNARGGACRRLHDDRGSGRSAGREAASQSGAAGRRFPCNRDEAGSRRQAAPAADPFAAIPPARPADVASIDAIVAALYDVISGDKGVERDWNRFRSLFYPGARMIPTGKSERTGKINARVVSPDTYIKSSESFLEGEGFHEQELARRVDSFGNIAQVFSSYEARHAVSEPKPFLRGINSIQLFNDGNRWWVMSMAWSPETAEHPLPKAYSEKQQR
jgi:hypothetical protein